MRLKSNELSRLFVSSREPRANASTKMAKVQPLWRSDEYVSQKYNLAKRLSLFPPSPSLSLSLFLSFSLSLALFAPSSYPAVSLSLSFSPLCAWMHASLKTDHPPFRGMENFVSRLATTINKFFPEKLEPDQKEFFTLVAREADLMEFDQFDALLSSNERFFRRREHSLQYLERVRARN